MNRKTIFIIDDDPSISDLYKERLEMDDFEVNVFDNGGNALENLFGQNIHPDLILLDIMMPKVGGLDFLDAVKSHEQTKNIPIIVLTAIISEETHSKSLAKGADDYLQKTKTTPKELVDRINNLLKQKNEA